MHFGLDIDVGSLPPLFGGELQEVNSDDSVNIALPKLRQETDSASTPGSKFLSDYIIAEVKNNSNRIDESVLKADFCNTLDKICQEEHHQNCEELSKQSLENVPEFQGRVDEGFIKEKVSDIDIDIASLLFEGELLDTNSGGDPVNIALPKLQRETDSAGTPASKLLSENNSNRIDKNVLKVDFYTTLKGELLDTNSGGDPVNIALPKLQRETDSAGTPASKLLSENNSNRIDKNVLKVDFYTTLNKMCQEEHRQNFEELSKQSLKNALEFQGRVYRNFTKKKAKLSEKQLVSTDRLEYPCIVTDCPFTHINRGGVKKHLFKHIKVSQYYCKQCLPDTFFARDKTELNRHIRLKHSTDSTLSKYGAKRICPPDQNTMNFFSECNVSQVSDQQQTDNASTMASNLLSDYTIAEVENNSNRIDESVLKADFCNTLDKMCQEEHHQNCEELSKQSLENALEFQGRADENFIKEKVSDIDSLSPLFEGELLDTNSGDPVNIALPKLQQQTDSASTSASNKLLSDYTIVEVENSSNRIDENALKTAFYNTLDKICQEKHHQNFEELSKQSLKKALEIQGEVYKDFIKEKVKFSKRQLVSPDEYGYPCIVTNCAFTHSKRAIVQVHLFKHTKVSPYYCEQCLPDTFFARDIVNLNKHKRSIHFLDKVISKPGIKRIHQPVQNTMNGSNGFIVNQESDPCLPKVRVKHRPIER